MLFRLARGSGHRRARGMADASPLPPAGRHDLCVRPLLALSPRPARRDYCEGARRCHSRDDPSNRRPALYPRAVCARLMPAAAAEGLDARGLARLARRVQRAEAAIECAVAAGAPRWRLGTWCERGPIAIDAERVARPAGGDRTCACSVARSRAPATKGRSNSASSNVLSQALRRARCAYCRRDAGRRVVTSQSGQGCVVERAPARRRRPAPATAARRNSGAASRAYVACSHAGPDRRAFPWQGTAWRLHCCKGT